MLRTKPLFLFTGKVPLTITRMGEATLVNGRWVDPTTTEVLITGNIQPLQRGTDTLLLPEADRSRAKYMLLTTDYVRAMLEGEGGWQADTLVYEGEKLEVLKVLPYKMGTLDHYEAILARVEKT